MPSSPMVVPYERRHFSLSASAVAFGAGADVVKIADHGHEAAAAGLDVVAAQKIILAIVFPPGNINVRKEIAARAVVIVRRDFLELRK